MRQQCPVFDGDRAAERLTELGLSVEVLEFALRGADAEARSYTPLDPPNMQGMARYSRTVRLLRERLIPFGWSFDNPRNLARTVSPDRRVAVITTLGDGATGFPHALPSTRYEKGLATIEAVGRNFLQLSLPIDLSDLEDRRPPGGDGVDSDDLDSGGLPTGDALFDAEDDGTATWILLYNVTDTEIRAELSLPDSMVEGYIDTWVERVVLPPIPLEPAVPLEPIVPLRVGGPIASDQAGEPDVLVFRRGA
ncbi:hypothetical protein [Rugosimonospora africana]|uniref:Uncharacterized protein n=1 Tax=Rugosimonospora africana TaxID=556532 RepID=A0A8J3QX14_9ACTN|nr:hypothetical protein [Rugosimonospora africana]GIH17677.1 hypothetical protein Raf01_58490 [Rugosimonospora africana]